MDAISEYNKRYEFFREITGEAMRVHRKYHGGLLESAYEAALKYLLELKGYKVERQVFLPMFWDEVRLDQTYRMDLVINGNIIVELKAINHVDTQHCRQLWNYMNLTHLPYGMLINFSPDGLYSEWYHRNDNGGGIDKIKLL
jgi:GxxExxY protein